MHDSLFWIVQIIQLQVELLAVFSKRIDLFAAKRVGYRQKAVDGRNIVIGCGEGEFRSADFAPLRAQPFKRLGTRYFMDQMKIDVEHRRLALIVMNDMGIPDFLEHRAWGIFLGHHGSGEGP